MSFFCTQKDLVEGSRKLLAGIKENCMLELKETGNSGVIVAGNHYLCLYRNGKKIMLHEESENSLLKVNLKTREIEEIPIPPHGSDHNHINGLSYVDPHHLYILFANGKIPEKSEIRKYC